MNANQLINMVIRMVLGPIIRRGVDAGIERVFSRGKAAADMSEEDRASAQSAKTAVHQARRTAQMARRMGRF